MASFRFLSIDVINQASPWENLGLAKTKLPDALARRHLLEGDLDASKALALAEAYLAAEREVEAVDFLEKAGAREALESLREEACGRGDVFLVRVVCRALNEDPPEGLWQRVADAAAAAGRPLEAEAALRLATV